MIKFITFLVFSALVSGAITAFTNLGFGLVLGCIVGAYALVSIYYAFQHGSKIINEAEERGVHPDVILKERREARRKKRNIDALQEQQKVDWENAQTNSDPNIQRMMEAAEADDEEAATLAFQDYLNEQTQIVKNNLNDDEIDEDAIRQEVINKLASTPVVVEITGPRVTAHSDEPFGSFNGFPMYEEIVLNHTDVYAYEGTTQFNNDGTPVSIINEDELCLESGIIYKYSHKVEQHNDIKNNNN